LLPNRLQNRNKTHTKRNVSEVILIQMIPNLLSNGIAQCDSAGNRTVGSESGGGVIKTSNSNVIVYVKQPARREQVRVISKAIGALDGVVKAQNSSRADNMICVD